MLINIPTAAEAFGIWVNSKEESIYNSAFKEAENSLLKNITSLVIPEHSLDIEELNTAYGAMCEENGFKNGYNYAITVILAVMIRGRYQYDTKEKSFNIGR